VERVRLAHCLDLLPKSVFHQIKNGGFMKKFADIERERGRNTASAFAVFGIFVMIGYIASIGFFQSHESIAWSILFSTSFVLICLIYLIFSRSSIYISMAWADYFFFMAALAAIVAISSKFSVYTGKYGLDYLSILLVNSGALAFASIFAINGNKYVNYSTIFSIASVNILVICLNSFSAQKALIFAAPACTIMIVVYFCYWELGQIVDKAYREQLSVDEKYLWLENKVSAFIPEDVINRLKAGERICESYAEVSVIFIDIVGFTKMTADRGANHLFEIIEKFFHVVDENAKVHSVERVKTIGDAYFAVCGARYKVENHAVSAINFGHDVINSLKYLDSVVEGNFQIRLGIHTGSVVGGIIGEDHPQYDYWGDTINKASRIQQHGLVNRVSVSKTTQLKAGSSSFSFLDQGEIEMKGLGSVQVYVADPL
jgi:adenylate cyclase